MRRQVNSSLVISEGTALQRFILLCADYATDIEESAHNLLVAFQLYLKHGQYPDALRVALRMGGVELHDRIKSVFKACTDQGVRKQMGYILGRHRAMAFIAHDDGACSAIVDV
jgi:hypothetical protein